MKEYDIFQNDYRLAVGIYAGEIYVQKKIITRLYFIFKVEDWLTCDEKGNPITKAMKKKGIQKKFYFSLDEASNAMHNFYCSN